VAQAIDMRLGGIGDMFEAAPTKPKWMRRPTYRRLCIKRQRASLAAMIGVLAPGSVDTQAIIREWRAMIQTSSPAVGWSDRRPDLEAGADYRPPWAAWLAGLHDSCSLSCQGLLPFSPDQFFLSR
jgi:hypothetical protein